jgi:hypothetical protein
MYEIEYKVEITEAERQKLITLFKKEGFLKKPEVLQNDYYIEVHDSAQGGYDFKRYRDEGEKLFYTEKIWDEVGGRKYRKENEREVSREEFERAIKKFPSAIKIQKTRQPFSGNFVNKKMHIDMDSVKFDHSATTRYFIEAEVISEDKEKFKTLKDSIIEFLRDSLGREIVEAPGMFSMAFKKL